MVKTDAATAATHSARASSFAEDLERLANSARSTTRDVTEAARPIAAKIKSAKITLSSCGDALTRQSVAIKRQERHCQSLLATRDAQMATFEMQARDLSSTTTAEIAKLVPRLQFADAFSQRLHNTRRFLEAAEEKGLGQDRAVLSLAAIQLLTLAADCVFERHAASKALSALREACEQAQTILVASDRDDGVQAWVHAVAEQVAMSAATIDTARQQMGLAFERIDDAFSATANVTAAIHNFEDLVKKLHIESLNGAIAVNQSRASHSATYVLAAEVRSAATQCAENLKACTDELAVIDDALGNIDRSAMERELETLTEAQSNARDIQAAQAANITAQAETRWNLAENVNAGVVACGDALEAFARNQEIETRLATLADSLSERPFDDVSLGQLDWVWPFYTTQPERDVHNFIVGPVEGGTLQSNDLEEDDDLDGFLL